MKLKGTSLVSEQVSRSDGMLAGASVAAIVTRPSIVTGGPEATVKVLTGCSATCGLYPERSPVARPPDEGTRTARSQLCCNRFACLTALPETAVCKWVYTGLVLTRLP